MLLRWGIHIVAEFSEGFWWIWQYVWHETNCDKWPLWIRLFSFFLFFENCLSENVKSWRHLRVDGAYHHDLVSYKPHRPQARKSDWMMRLFFQETKKKKRVWCTLEQVWKEWLNQIWHTHTLTNITKYLGVLHIVESQEFCSMMKLNSEAGWQCSQPNLCWSWICSGVEVSNWVFVMQSWAGLNGLVGGMGV